MSSATPPRSAASLDARLARVLRSPFRAQFHLRAREVTYADDKGPEIIQRHAQEFIAARLAPAEPRNDGKQTPWGGHPVFRAQHASATCCRGCLAKHHNIERGRPLTDDEQTLVVALIMQWIFREMQARPGP